MSAKILHLPSRLAAEKQLEEENTQKELNGLKEKKFRALVLFYANADEVAAYQEEVQELAEEGKPLDQAKKPESQGAEIFISDNTVTEEQAAKLVVVDQIMTGPMTGEDLAVEVEALREELRHKASGQEDDSDASVREVDRPE